MDPSLRTAASGMIAQQTRVDIIANNLANVNTTAFKRSRAHFEDLLYQTIQGNRLVGEFSENALPAVQVGRGTRLSATLRVHTQGSLEPTLRPMDVAIDGPGFFQVEMPDGSLAYTRDGSFQVSADGVLMTQSGYPVVPDVSFPAEFSDVVFSRDGTVSAVDGVTGELVEIGRLELVRFPNPTGLLARGENLLTETPSSGAPFVGVPQEEGFGKLVAGHLETSNVEIVQEMVDMISALRAYEIASKAIQTSEDMADVTSSLFR